MPIAVVALPARARAGVQVHACTPGHLGES